MDGQCGRCRKRKIRCSGDMGQGQPCQNCKNAGADQCLFLRVQWAPTLPLPFPLPVAEGYHDGYDTYAESDSLAVLQVASREAPFLTEPGVGHAGSPGGAGAVDFTYSPVDARVLANRAPVAIPSPYPAADIPSSDVLTSPYHRSSTAYPYATKSYYPAVSTYPPQYGADEFDYHGMQPVLSSDVAMMQPSNWPSRKSSTYSNMYMDPPSSYYPSATPLVHRPAPSVPSDSAGSLSLSGFGAELPSTSDRVLPYPGTGNKPPSSTSSSSGSGTLADVAAAASYVSAFDSSLSYGSGPSSTPPTAHSHSHSHQHRSEYGSAGASLYSERQRALHSQSAYKFEAAPVSGLDGDGGPLPNGLQNGRPYVPSEPLHSPVGHGYHPQVAHVGSVEARVPAVGSRH